MKTLSIKKTVYPPERPTINEWFCYIGEQLIKEREKNLNPYAK